LISRATVCAALLALASGCADFERGAPSPDAGAATEDAGQGGTAAISFAETVHPLLIAGCQSCHRSGGAAGSSGYLMTGEVAADLAASSALIEVSDPPLSRLLRKAAGLGHGGGAIQREGTAEYETLLAWISGGARP
jgi:hypothetical protein